MPLILASSSTYRRELLARLGVDFVAVAADIDETRQPGEPPARLAERLARQKAAAVAERYPHAHVIGSDQVAALGDEVLSKPGTVERAERQLRQLSGQTHLLITAVCLRTPAGESLEETLVHEMRMRALDDAEIAAYIAEDQPLDCCGAYKIEAGGIRLFQALRGDDYTAIIGLPLTVVRRLLDAAEYPNA